MSSSLYVSVTCENPTSGAWGGHGCPVPVANKAKLAPSNTNHPDGANANQDDDSDASQLTD
jgi:hypothetical protein